ncbi:MAG: TonB family protein [Hyphomonadaceae bacterium]|nr:TonB family protein [Hyphomonadaceae bacterium]
MIAFITTVRRGLAALVLGVCAVAPASADLAAFNRSVLASDFYGAANAAAETWPSIDKKRAEIGVIAREFAWMSMLGGRPKDARTYSEFLIGLSPPADPSPETSKILHAWSGFRLTPTEGSRKALLAALEQRVAAGGADLVGQVAAADLLRFAETEALRADAVRARAIIAELDARRGPVPLVRQRQAELVAIINAFGEKQDAGPYQAMVQLDEALHREAFHPANASMREELFAIHDEAWAWRVVMESVIRSSGKQYPVIAARHPEQLWLRDPDRSSKKPACLGWLTGMKDIKYPFKERKDRLTGAVIVDVAIAPDGSISSSRILSAVPPESGFNAAVLKSLETAKFKSVDGIDLSKCRIERDHHAQSMQFGFEMRERWNQ